MSKAIYWQRGEDLDYKNGTSDTIEAGSVVSLKTRIAIAGMDIRPGEVGSIHVKNVFKFDKTEFVSYELDLQNMVWFQNQDFVRMYFDEYMKYTEMDTFLDCYKCRGEM